MDLPGRITIAGVGLIGGSLGMALRRKDNPPEVVGFGTSPSNLELAVERGAIDRWTTDLADAVAGTDLFVVCTPVRKIVPIIEQAVPHLKKGAIVTDVGSTKSFVVNQAERIMPDGIHFIGGHPMAGSEITGIGGANPNLFQNALYILTPTEHTPSQAYGVLHALIDSVGARVISIPPHIHDEMMAMVSHMPHVVAAALVNAVASEQDHSSKSNILALTAGGFRDMTRIAASGADVWVDICMTNPDAIVRAIDQLQSSLDEMRNTITNRDEGRLRALLEQAGELRRNLPGTVQKEPGRHRLRILIHDDPGVISTVTSTVGERGINIIDLELLHLKEGGEALLELSFATLDQARGAEAALSEAGFLVQLIGGTQ